ncbi:MAG: prepilin-type N-terminal cleavage/methylation domain-containing protein [Candidatus Electrothrix sp. AUS1_2]|nr:prepilin-type N-terminal cleavage/methylation domain-containing protein [Candidatus Electrothrix sp. AUS1_2]
MMREKKMNMQQEGFTLIETIIAMAIFTIGILGLFGMQSAAIKKNLTANNITTGATLAADRVEQLLALNYDDDRIAEGGTAGIDQYKPCADFSSSDWWEDYDETGPDPDPFIQKDDFSGDTANQPDYFVYWAVARDCTLIQKDGVGLDEDSPYRPKHLYIVVTRDNGSGNEEPAAQFSYIKQNPNY